MRSRCRLKGVLIGPCVEAESSRSVTAVQREYFKRGEEVHELLRLVLIAHPHFVEIMLRKFTGRPSNRTSGVTTWTRSRCSSAFQRRTRDHE
jgi:hypothetical protein